MKIKWLKEPEDHDYPAALSYLSLLYDSAICSKLVESLRAAEVTEFKAKDILRACGLSLLGVSNSHIAKDKQKIKNGENLSPLLLVRKEHLIIADGYHRLCAVYSLNEDAVIPVKIVQEIMNHAPYSKDQIRKNLLKELVEKWWLLDWDFNSEESSEFLERVKASLKD